MQKKKKNQAHAGVEPPTPLASLRHTTVIVTLTRGMGLPTVLHGLVACHTQQIRPTHTSTSSSAFYAPTNQHVRILLASLIETLTTTVVLVLTTAVSLLILPN